MSDEELTQEEFDDGIRQCLEMGLLEALGEDEHGDKKYRLTNHGWSHAESSVVHLITLISKYERLQSQLNEAVAVIERIVEQARISGRREDSHRLFGMDDFTTRIEDAEDFLAKHTNKEVE